MNLSGLGLTPAAVPAPLPTRRYETDPMQLLSACRVAWEQGAQLVALWASDERDRGHGFVLRVALRDADGVTILEHALPAQEPNYPDLSAIFPAASRMQRATFDLFGIEASAEDLRPWLWQASWPVDQFPLRRDFAGIAQVATGGRGLRVRARDG